MLRPAGCQSVSRYLARSPFQGRPCLAGVRPLVSSLYPEQPSNTVLSLLLTKVPRRSLRGFKRTGSRRSCSLRPGRFCSFFGPSDIFLSTEQPESTPRVSYPTTQVSTDCRIDLAVVCRVVFKVFPCRLWVVGQPRPRPPAALTSGECWRVL